MLDGTLVASTTSTERVTMTATWTDLVDDPTLDAPEPRSTSVVLGDLLVTRSDKNEVSIESLRAELHDTKRHLASVDPGGVHQLRGLLHRGEVAHRAGRAGCCSTGAAWSPGRSR